MCFARCALFTFSAPISLRFVMSLATNISARATASKVFEDRLVNKGLHAEFPDFEAVYHLVIDAVDSYNDGWERSFKEQEMLKVCLTSCT